MKLLLCRSTSDNINRNLPSVVKKAYVYIYLLNKDKD